MSFQSRGRSAALSAAISVILASPALAGAPSSGSVQLEEIVVTAQRAETNLQQTPISVAAVSGAQLAEQGASSLFDLTSFIPNLQVGSTTLQGAGNGRFAIRGIGTDAGSGAAVGLYIDEVFYPTGAGNLMGLFDVDRVEVLRGPQGTLFGRNTIAGAIQYITAKPGKEFGGYVEATGGNFNRTDFNGALNIPLGEALAARVAVGYNSRDGYVHDNFRNVDRGEDERKAGRVSLRWTPSSSLTLDLKGEWLANENNGRASTIHGYQGSVFPNGQNDGAQFPFLGRILSPTPNNVHLCPAIGGPPSPGGACFDAESTGYQMAGLDAEEYSELDYTSGALVVNWELSDAIAIKSITGYSKTGNKVALDYDTTPLSLFSGVGPRNDTTALSEELQLRLNLLDDRLHWTTGLFYYDQDSESLTAFAFGNVTPNPANATGSKGETESQAIFTRLTFDFTDRLSGSVGLRYSEEDVTSRTLSAAGALGPEFKGNFDDTSPQFGLQFQATDAHMYYVNAAKGFRAGGFGTNPGFVGGVKSFDPEEAWTYELGARMEFMDRRLRVNPTVFFTDWTGIQVNTLISVPEPGASCPPGGQNCPGVGTVPQNVGDAEIKGLEFEALFQATERLTLQASVGIQDSKYTELNPNLVRAQVYPTSLGGFPAGEIFVPKLCDGNGDPTLAQMNPTRTAAQLAPLVPLYECKGGSDLSRSPEMKFSVGARYAMPLSSGGQIVTSADYGWTDDQRSQVSNLDQTVLPSYGVLNARVQYNAPDNRWSLALFGTNLTDEYYYQGSADFANGYTPGTTVWDVARPVEYGATVKFNFGGSDR